VTCPRHANRKNFNGSEYLEIILLFAFRKCYTFSMDNINPLFFATLLMVLLATNMASPPDPHTMISIEFATGRNPNVYEEPNVYSF
jgi:hypothetical protein